MIKTNKFIVFILVGLIVLSVAGLPVYASGTESNYEFEETDLPQGLNFTVNDICTGHAYFMQAAANEQGEFAVLSLHVNPNDIQDFDFGKVYVDLYNSDGVFYQEISFETASAFVIQLETDCLNMYFQDFLMVYDLDTQELTNYAIPPEAPEYGGMEELRAESFSAGDWEYTCRKGVRGYVELTRTDGSQVQVLVQARETLEMIVYLVLPLSVIALAVIVVFFYLKGKNRRRLK